LRFGIINAPTVRIRRSFRKQTELFLLPLITKWNALKLLNDKENSLMVLKEKNTCYPEAEAFDFQMWIV
jgi:hypothetical protein